MKSDTVVDQPKPGVWGIYSYSLKAFSNETFETQEEALDARNRGNYTFF